MDIITKINCAAYMNLCLGKGRYDLMLDSSAFGVDGSCNLIIEGLKQRQDISSV